jgi:hypothetical protein
MSHIQKPSPNSSKKVGAIAGILLAVALGQSAQQEQEEAMHALQESAPPYSSLRPTFAYVLQKDSRNATQYCADIESRIGQRMDPENFRQCERVIGENMMHMK